VNDHLHPVFAGILNATAGRPDSTPVGEVPVPKALMFEGYPYTTGEQVRPSLRTFMSRSGFGEGSKVCPFCGIEHDNAHRYCDDRCAQLDNL